MDLRSCEKVFDFSDEATNQVEVESQWIQYQNGSHVREEAEDGRENFRRLTEMEKTGQDDDADCSCHICISKRKYCVYVRESLD
jgi:hypothetical protein